MTTGGVGRLSATTLMSSTIVGDRTGTQRLVSRAAAMAAKADRQSAITLVGEEAQEVFVPTPCRMPGAVDEEQRDRVGFTDTPPVDHLKHVAHGFLCALGTLQPPGGRSSLEQPQFSYHGRPHKLHAAGG